MKFKIIKSGLTVLLAALNLFACQSTFDNQSEKDDNLLKNNKINTHYNNSRAKNLTALKLSGWIESKKVELGYSHVIVSLYMTYNKKLYLISQQKFSGKLPIKYFFSISPNQLGQGELTLKAELLKNYVTISKIIKSFQYQHKTMSIDLQFIDNK